MASLLRLRFERTNVNNRVYFLFSTVRKRLRTDRFHLIIVKAPVVPLSREVNEILNDTFGILPTRPAGYLLKRQMQIKRTDDLAPTSEGGITLAEMKT